MVHDKAFVIKQVLYAKISLWEIQHALWLSKTSDKSSGAALGLFDPSIFQTCLKMEYVNCPHPFHPWVVLHEVLV